MKLETELQKCNALVRRLQMRIQQNARHIAALKTRPGQPGLFREFVAAAVHGLKYYYSAAVREKNLRTQARKAKESIAALLESMSDGYLVYDRQLNFVFLNNRASEILGKSPVELLGRSLVDVYPELRGTETHKTLERAFSTQQAKVVEDYIDGNWLESRLYPSPHALTVLFSDISERKRQEAVLREREAYFREMVDSAPALIWLTDEDGNYVYVSRAWKDFVGGSGVAQLTSWAEHIHADNRVEALRVFSEAVQKQCPFTVEYRLRDSDRWALDAGRPRYNENGEFQGIIGSLVDITERRRVETALRDSSSRLALTQQAAGIVSWEFDLRTRQALWSQGCRQLLGLTLDSSEISLETWRSAIHPDDLPGLDQSFRDAIAAGTEIKYEYRLIWPDKTVRWIICRGFAEPAERNQVKKVLGVSIDITERKVVEEELKAAKEVAESASVSKSVFLANMSHEIRTPLNAIIGFSELLRDLNVDEGDKNHFLETIARNGRQLTQLIDDILDLSKVEANKVDVEHMRIALPNLITEVTSSLSIKARDKGINLSVETDGVIPETVESDPVRLRQILLNVIGNAIKFTDYGSVRVALKLLPGSDDNTGKLRFDVTDTGRGIPDSRRSELFHAFVQADSSTTRKYGGTGLGLILSRKLARLLGGDVTLINSELGHGSTFRVEIDVGYPRHTAESKGARSEEKMRLSAHSATRLQGVKILVAEDAPDNQLLIERMLARHGARVDIVDDGAQAVEMALRNKYDLVLMDIQMPKLDGYGATLALRTHGYTGPIIALTAHAMPEEREKCLRAGCNDHLTKPISQPRLLYTVTRYISPRNENETSEGLTSRSTGASYPTLN